MKIFVLHDPRRPTTEFDACVAELNRQGIYEHEDGEYQYEIQYPILANSFHGAPTTTEQSINWSHKNLVTLAKLLGYPEICIMESDVMFPAADGWKYFLANKPAFFDLYLAGVYSNDMEFFRGLRPVLADSIIPVAKVNGFHCYIVHAGYYDTFLGTRDDEHIDVAQVSGNFKVCYPFAAIQRPGWSANNKKKDCDYNVNLLSEDVHGW